MRLIDPAGKLFQHLDRLSVLQAGGMPAPINIEIDLSNRCSLGCSWCHFAYTHTRGPLAGKREKPAAATAGGDLMDVDLAERIVEDFKRAGVESVTWTGGGEPTLHPDFDHIIQHTAATGLAQGIYTHGGHVKERRAELLKQALTFVYVSLDAASAEAYKRDKGVDRFQAACDGISNLVAARGAATIGVGFLLTRENWRDAEAMLSLSNWLGADYCQFRPTILYDQADPTKRAEDLAWMREAMPMLERLASQPRVEVDLGRFKRYESWAGHGYQTCYWSALQSVVTPNGKMWTCVNKREHAAEELGDLSAESFDSIWGRHSVQPVNERCRLLCRGDVANQTLDSVMRPAAHAAFV